MFIVWILPISLLCVIQCPLEEAPRYPGVICKYTSRTQETLMRERTETFPQVAVGNSTVWVLQENKTEQSAQRPQISLGKLVKLSYFHMFFSVYWDISVLQQLRPKP